MSPRPWIGAGFGLALVAVLMWPALYNGQPIFFGDTSAYIRGADAGVQALFHRRSAWSLTGGNAIVDQPAATAIPAAPITRATATSASATAASATSAAPAIGRSGSASEGAAAAGMSHGSSIEDKSVVYGRSPYYGALLYLGDLTGGFWLSIALQAGAVVLSLVLLLRAVRPRLSPGLLAAGIGLAGATTAPFFASFLEPDIFAGVAVITCAALLGGASNLRSFDFLLGFALLSLCVVVHESHILIVAAMLALGILSRIPSFLSRLRAHDAAALGALAGALGVAVASQLVFSAAVRHVVGAAPLRPPFLMARMINDGPGYRYLRATCPGNGFAVCAYLGRLPLAANRFLWDSGPHGVFSAVPPAVRRRLANDQSRFVVDVLRYDPFGEIRNALRDVGTQLTMTGLDEFEYPAGLKRDFALKIPAPDLQRMRRTAAYRGTMPLGPFAKLSLATSLLGTAVVLVAALWPASRRRLPRQLAAVTAWIMVGIIINAMVCGILSGPHNRYAARVVWIIPLMALLIGAAAWEGRRRRAQATAALA